MSDATTDILDAIDFLKRFDMLPAGQVLIPAYRWEAEENPNWLRDLEWKTTFRAAYGFKPLDASIMYRGVYEPISGEQIRLYYRKLREVMIAVIRAQRARYRRKEKPRPYGQLDFMIFDEVSEMEAQ